MVVEILSKGHDNPKLQLREGPCHPIQLLGLPRHYQITVRPHLEVTHLHQQLSKNTPIRLLEGTNPHPLPSRSTCRRPHVDIKVPILYQINRLSKVLST